MADNWSGIVLNNYQAVMPVPWRKKFGIRYCYSVPFVQQLGAFGSDQSQWNSLFPLLFSYCNYGDYNFNFSSKQNIVSHVEQTNFILDLASGFDVIQLRYNKDLSNNLKRAEKFCFTYAQGNINDAINIFKAEYQKRFPHVSANDYSNFHHLCNALQAKQQIFVRQVQSKSGSIISIALFIKDAKRIYNILNATTAEGKKFEANPWLLNGVIKEFANTNYIFDFEGSDVPGIKQFYQKFGAQQQPYFSIHFNHLPPLIKWLKR